MFFFKNNFTRQGQAFPRAPSLDPLLIPEVVVLIARTVDRGRHEAAVVARPAVRTLTPVTVVGILVPTVPTAVRQLIPAKIYNM